MISWLCLPLSFGLFTQSFPQHSKLPRKTTEPVEFCEVKNLSHLASLRFLTCLASNPPMTALVPMDQSM